MKLKITEKHLWNVRALLWSFGIGAMLIGYGVPAVIFGGLLYISFGVEPIKAEE